jgi:hypothetical protein
VRKNEMDIRKIYGLKEQKLLAAINERVSEREILKLTQFNCVKVPMNYSNYFSSVHLNEFLKSPVEHHFNVHILNGY